MSDDYLWDRSGTPDPELVKLESLLGPLGAGQPPPPGFLIRVPPPRPSRLWLTLASAAAIALMAGAGWWFVRLASPPVVITRVSGAPTVASAPVRDRGVWSTGRLLETGDEARAHVDVGDIGSVEIDPRSRVTLLTSPRGNYRFHLQRGTLHAVIWAPPGRFSVDTPSSTTVDLGCAYTLSVDDEGAGIVRVSMGWVGFEWQGRESFIPAGAVCATRIGSGPGTPRFEDTSADFVTAIDVLDFGNAGSPAASAALDRVLDEARPKDAITLWHLLSRVAPPDRDRVFDRLATLVPPPAGVTRDGIRSGDRQMLDRWWEALGLGTASWWRTWLQQWRK